MDPQYSYIVTIILGIVLKQKAKNVELENLDFIHLFISSSEASELLGGICICVCVLVFIQILRGTEQYRRKSGVHLKNIGLIALQTENEVMGHNSIRMAWLQMRGVWKLLGRIIA